MRDGESFKMRIIDHGLNRIIENLKDVPIPWKDQTVLISGGAGFLGSWTAETFVKKGSKVIVVDNLASGKMENIESLLKSENFEFIKKDISKTITIDEKIDYIFHMASRASPFEFVKFPIEILKANTLGILSTLEMTM